jgi:hypothetical protein
MAEVIVRSLDNLRQEIAAGPHTLFADEPASAGGGDAGPDPYELLLSALGACTSMTLLLYARRKRWPLDGVEVRLSHRRDYARDCEECEERAGSAGSDRAPDHAAGRARRRAARPATGDRHQMPGSPHTDGDDPDQ